MVQIQITDVQSGVDRLWQVQDSAKHRRLMEWISPTDYAAQQSDIIKLKQEGTGQWFLDAPEVARWRSEPNATLFCPGIPGAGKTTIAAIAIDYLLKSVHNSSHGVAYIYCNYKTQEQDVSDMLAAILKRLVQTRPSIAEPVERLHRLHAGNGTRPLLEEMFKALQDVLVHYPTTHIVVDALDECPEQDREEVLRFVTGIVTAQIPCRVKVFITSRREMDIAKAFEDKHIPIVQIRAENVATDIETFVRSQVEKLRKGEYGKALYITSDDLKDRIVQVLAKKADGM